MDKRVVREDGKLIGGDSLAVFVIKLLLAGGLKVNVTIDGQVYEGWVHNLDYASGSEPGLQPDYVFAQVRVPELNQGDDSFSSVRVAIYTNGTVRAMPDFGHEEDVGYVVEDSGK